MGDRIPQWGFTMVTNSEKITQNSVKRVCADALNDVVRNRRLTHGDLADLIGCGPTTITNRLKREDRRHPLTIFELARGIKEFGPEFGNSILVPLTGHMLTKAAHEDVCLNELKITTSKALTLLLELLEDNDLSDEDAMSLSPVLVKLISKYQSIVARAFAVKGAQK